jgi:integrase
MSKGHRIKHVRRKVAKGHVYLYFDTGVKNEAGKPILARLPDANDPTFGTALAAAKAGRNRRGSVQQVLTVGGLANLYEKSADYSALADKSKTLYATYLRQIRKALAPAPAREIARRDVLMIRDRMADKPGAANALVRTLGALYSWGRERDYVENSPTKGIRMLAQGEHEPWQPWLIEAALDSDDATVRLGVALLYYTAQRIGDVCKMRWTDIRGRSIELEAQKTGVALSIPLHSRLAQILTETPRSAFTILLRDGEPWKPEALRVYLQVWAKAHGAKVVAHGLRKSAVNALLEAGCSVAETASISGQTLQMVEHYAKKRNQPKLASAAMHLWDGGNKTGKGKRK